jgi:molecular chaperone DnaK
MPNTDFAEPSQPDAGARRGAGRSSERPGKTPRAARGAGVASARLPCPHCHVWENDPADTYCSFCGHLLLALSVDPEEVVLIAGMAPQRVLAIKNSGPLAHQAILVPLGPALAGLTVEPAGPMEIPAEGSARLVLRLDEEQLPRDLRVQQLAYALVVDNDRHKMVPVAITVKIGPRPVLMPPALEFGELAEGTQAVRRLELANLGGIPLRVMDARVEGSRQLFLVEPPAWPALVLPGERLALEVAWDTRRAAEQPEVDATGLRLVFGNYPAALFASATVRLFRFSLAFDRDAIRIPSALSKQDYIETVTLTNTGTIDVEITGIESDQAWIEVVTKERSISLRCKDSPARAATADAKGDSCSFEVVCHPQQLEGGRHLGKVTVLSAGQEQRTLEVEIHVIRPQPAHDYLGIDFGTSNSVIALYDERTSEAELVEVPTGKGASSPLIPSVLLFVGGTDTYKIGHDALNEVEVSPDRTVRSVKRIMGYDHQREFFGRSFTPEQLAALIIKKLVQLAEEQYFKASGRYLDFRKAIVTVPANFYDLQIRGVLEACRLAGLDTEEAEARQAAQRMRDSLQREINAGIILDEPSAAALYYLDHLESLGGLAELSRGMGKRGGLNLLVFDYGGGTLDVSVANVVRLDDGGAGLSVLANMGNNRIGGDTIDLTLMRKLLQRCKEEIPSFDDKLIQDNFKELETRSRVEGWRNTPRWQEVLRARDVWKSAAEMAKVQLSSRAEADVSISAIFILRSGNGKIGGAENPYSTAVKRPFSTKITRSEFEQEIEGILKQCENLVRSALSLAQLGAQDIDYVLHTGRQSLLPAVRKRVKALFPALPPGHDLLEEEHVKVCVAKGAVLYGSMKRSLIAAEGAGVRFLSEGRRLPHSYGVEKRVGPTRREFDEIVPRGATYPRVEERHFPESMISDPNGSLNLKFYQNTGENKLIRGNPEISLIGQITVDTRANGKPGCEIRFMIDANRKLEVSADGRQVEINPVRLQGEETWVG